ncbi:ethylmalonyl-CoA decarboxylase [Protopterus annectens]|uniref:ethylmalonyl-CoA decarboxylase n=1 Tax=Protopterus annectens TaxID=7888 RepID=UPI001CFA9474|nr:ethylmalonyl-CoA decarboxylase [Protopterus annectens]XP_043920013.1 ethylmalonyl-CoA decarboxylase [Protopterus annectens]
MAAYVRKSLLQSTWRRLLQQKHRLVYTASQEFNENEITEKLQQFPGGSIDLKKGNDGIAFLTVNNPSKMNAFSGAMMVQLKDQVEELEGWSEGKGLILHGAANTFCSGSDLNSVKAISNPQDGMEMCMFMQNVLTRLMRLPLISVAVVQGKALGGGAELTTACDFRLLALGSEIRFVHKHMGVVPGWGGAARLVQIVGSRTTLKLLSTAQKVDPEIGLKLGLADAILTSFGEERILNEARSWLSQYTKGPPEIIKAIKKVVVSGKELPFESALQTEKDIFGTVWGGPVNLKVLAQGSKHKKIRID